MVARNRDDVLVALVAGLVRAIGPGGVPLGLMVGAAFLIGTNVPVDLSQTIESGMLYLLGGLWTILVALVFWRMRPFKRLEQEVAAVWEGTAPLIAAMRAVEAASTSLVRRRRRERAVAKSHQGLREAVERARGSLGTIRAELSGPGTTAAQLMIVVRAASRIAAAGVTLAELRHRNLQHRGAKDDAGVIDASTQELESACRAVAVSILAGGRKFSLTAMRGRLIELTSAFGETDPEVMTFAQAMRHLENTEEVMNLFLGTDQRFPGVLLPPLSSGNPRGYLLAAIRAQLSLRSAI